MRLRIVPLLVLAVACAGDPATGNSGSAVPVVDTEGDSGPGTDATADVPGPDGSEDDAGGDVQADGADEDTPNLGDGELCAEDRECASGVCVRVDLGSGDGFCTRFCLEAEDCDEGDECVFFVNAGGDAVRVCIPSDLCIDADEDGYGLGAGCLGGDCDDTDPTINPAAEELCDFIDNDCDGFRDDNVVGVGDLCATGFVGACSAGTLACVGGVETCESARASGPEICDGIDNDCDEAVDELEDGEPISRGCYGGPAGTEGVGQCRGGTRICVEGTFGDCLDQQLPFPEICDGEDNDCDGEVDEDAIGGTARCDTGLLGACALGFAGCGEGEGTCVQVTEASPEVCDGLDNDCDGAVDDAEDGGPLTRTCYEGDDETLGIGTCEAGEQVCSDGDFGPCLGDTPPGVELCDGLDNDCDEEVDEDAVGGGASCATGLPGICALGVAACETGGEGEGCIPILEASDELCDGLDNDCDGEIDESTDGGPLTRGCYSGDPDTIDVGVCTGGVESCVAGLWSACLGQVLPGFETCDGRDNDCNGEVDEGAPGSGLPCGTGGAGACATGLTACVEGTLTCEATADPTFETCDGVDNDCDGSIDEGLDERPLARTCYEGDEELVGTGVCVRGEQSCIDGEFGACLGDVGPTDEICDGEDNDCDGVVDEDAIGGGACRTGLPGVCATGVVTCDVGGTTGCVPIFAAGPETCDGLDNDCDGVADEDEDGDPLARSCYGGADGTRDVGLCEDGTESCVGGSWSACVDQVLPSFERCDGLDNDCDGSDDNGNPGGGLACDTGELGICAAGLTVCTDDGVDCARIAEPSEEVCDGLDNDCDGEIDEVDVGEPLTRTCYDGRLGSEFVGLCEPGMEECVAGSWSSCLGQTLPSFEICDGADNDCDGVVDEDAIGGGACRTGLPGVCATGVVTCDVGGTTGCVPIFAAGPETCDGLDNDCDGVADEDEDGDPLARSCYGGADGTRDVGLCEDGTESCVGGSWSACVDQVLPSFERCDGLDNDCDGSDDNGNPGGGLACDTGELGICAAGLTVCTDDGVDCARIAEPSEEVCDGLDNDCDGEIDEVDVGEPLTRTCYDGPPESEFVGLCEPGVEECVAGTWSSCLGQTLPSFEICDGEDNDCDGEIDDGDPEGGVACDTGELGVCARGVSSCIGGGLACLKLYGEEPETCDGFDNDCDGTVDEDVDGEPLARDCYDGPAGSEGVGSCEGGAETCRFGDYGGCVGQVIPVTEVCDEADNDCDGETDEGALLEFFVDADRDGFGDPDTIVFACEGAGFVTNGDDCYDDNSAANPEQEGYFGSDRGDGSFDYNCDDVETSFFGGFGTCSSDPPLCFLIEEGWFDDGSGAMPACGETGIYIFDCLGNGANCDPTTAETTQRCR